MTSFFIRTAYALSLICLFPWSLIVLMMLLASGSSNYLSTKDYLVIVTVLIYPFLLAVGTWKISRKPASNQLLWGVFTFLLNLPALIFLLWLAYICIYNYFLD